MNLHAKILCSVLALTCATVDGAVAKTRPEYKSKLSGYEFGMGVPLVTPLTGYNFFVGYVNKDADSFWGRRFGIRADFTIPSTLQFKGTLSGRTDGQNGYLVDGSAKIMGFDLKLSDFTDEKIEVDPFEDDNGENITLGQNAADLTFKMTHKNAGLLVDFYPFGDTWFLGGLRFSGGYYLGDLDISLNAHINENIDYSYKVNKRNVSGIDRYDILRARIKKGSSIGADFHWKYNGPYAGLGFDLGIWHGFKFYMDAGVVFAKAPKVTNKNVKDDKLVLQGRYEIYDDNGTPYSAGSEMVDILPNGIAEEPNVERIVQDTVGMVVRDTLDHYSSQYQEYQDVIDSVLLNINGNGSDIAGNDEFKNTFCNGANCSWGDIQFGQLGKDVVDFLNDDSTAPWITTLLSEDTELTDTVNGIKNEWKENVGDATAGIQKDIDDAWADYNDEKEKTIKDVNDFLEDYGMIPMVKIGFMYRF